MVDYFVASMQCRSSPENLYREECTEKCNNIENKRTISNAHRDMMFPNVFLFVQKKFGQNK
jgi:hypothetical protein